MLENPVKGISYFGSDSKNYYHPQKFKILLPRNAPTSAYPQSYPSSNTKLVDILAAGPAANTHEKHQLLL